MPKINSKSLVISLILIFLLLLAGCTLPEIKIPPAPAPSPSPPTTPVPPPTAVNPTWTPPSPANLTTTLPNIAEVVALVKLGVVTIDTELTTLGFFGRALKGAGSGWIVDKNGIIVTNNHVVEGASTITVTLDDGKAFAVDAKNVFTDPLNDLAILKIDAQNLPALKVGSSAKMRVGDWVIAIGNALGQGIRATEGIVSRKGVSLPVEQGQTLYDLIETTAAINQGNSGGPLVNLAGEVIGITSAKIATVGVEGMGYAISTATAIPIIEALVQKGYVTRPWLGVRLYTVDQIAILRFKLALDKGALVTEVVAGSPAAKAGMKAGDVIVKVNDKEIATAEELIRVIHTAQIKQKLVITFWRGKTENTTEAVLAESPPPPR